ncbi:anti-anti-sigma factor [Streptomyces sp. CB00316]|uniref:STAS domain-containing protein n=1 Tax=unclassified Streptomyces TaxID=2593676 RepID=UPI00093923F8|nr:STAS domain-containing protein [Streptomyces sp. CB00316]OKJ20049.1 anti-anti-sigma factor [Streptomyces sp. CB00316]
MAEQDSKSDLAGLLSADRERVVDQWIDSVVGSLRGRVSKAEVDRELRELYSALVEALTEGGEDARGENLSETRALLTELSRNRARQGFTPSETAVSVLALKKAFEPALRDGSAEDTDRYLRLSRVLDDLALFTIETYTRTREEIISSQANQLMELSTPVVKLWDGVIAVPLVGTLDSARTQVVMEKLLQALVDTGSEQAIIDITGVPAVDTQVAQHLLKTIVAARLMGAECTVSGIRPQIAQTIVALGIEFGDIVTKATLADALQLALKKSGIDLVAHQGGGR